MLCPHRPLRIPANFPHSLVWQVALGDINPFYVTFECWSCRRHTTSDSRARKIENSLPQPPFPVKRWKPVTYQARKATGACARNVVGIVAQAVGGARHRVLDTAQIIADAPARTAVRLLCRALALIRAALVQGSVRPHPCHRERCKLCLNESTCTACRPFLFRQHESRE